MNPRRLLPTVILALASPLLAMERPPARPTPTPAAPGAPATPAPAAFPSPPAAIALPPAPANFVNAPTGAGLKVDFGYQDETTTLNADTELNVQFPEAMVPPDRIDAEDSPSPLVSWPPIDAKWVWRTQSSGTWTVTGPRIPGQTYRLQLRDGLADLAGKALPVAAWGVELTTEPLSVSTDYSERDRLSARPQVGLDFNYPVRLHDAAAACWFQDRLTRERFPAEILLNRADGEVSGELVDVTSDAERPQPKDFRARPRAPLPVGRFYDLIVDGVADAYAGRPLPYPDVFALGRTEPMRVDYVVARNWAGDKPHIEIKFTDRFTDETEIAPDLITLDPPVANLSVVAEGQFLTVRGDFDPAKRYRVSIAETIVGERGYPLAKAELWGATFRPKEATLNFPVGTFRQRAALGLRFALFQANTGPVTWRLARVPLERLEEIRKAVAEPRAPVIDARQLAVVATGELPAATDDQEIVRQIEWRPPAGEPALNGPYVLEATARDSEGRTIGNDALVFFNDAVFTQKRSRLGTELRLARMGDAQPIAGVRVGLLTGTLLELGAATTDAQGRVFFPADAMVGTSFFRADLPDGPVVELAEATASRSFANTGSLYAPTIPPYRGLIITDRPLYRPGEEIKFKGFLRRDDRVGDLVPPAAAELHWEIVSVDRDERVAEGRTKVNAFGGWDAAWQVPPQGRLGSFKVVAHVGADPAGDAGYFQVEEFRNPAFSVVCETVDATQPSTSTIAVSSEYFHGAPNVGSRVKWTATWIGDSDGSFYYDEFSDGFTAVDLYSQSRRAPTLEMEVSGETTLDAKGRATLTSAAPFNDPGLRAHSNVLWRVDVTGPDGQTITGGAEERVTMNEVTLGVRRETDNRPANELAFTLRAVPRDETQSPPAEVQAELFLVRTKSVKERLAPFVFRYRNTDDFVSVENRRVAANGELVFKPATPGRYVLVVSPLPGQPGIRVSEEAYLSGDGESENPVQNEQTLTLRPVHREKPVPIGTDAEFDLLTPGTGVAWVTVETDRVLESFTIPIPGNTTRLKVPMKPGYAPGVHVSVYVLRPGGDSTLPGEMYGSAFVEVTQPEAQLALAVATDKTDYEPRQSGTITVRATTLSQPVRDAEITLYAVDDAVLELGGWVLPGLLGTFQPIHPFNVVTYAALTGYIERFSDKALTQKGYVVGSGGKDEFGNTRFVRQDFRPLILWLPSVRTDAKGVATAKFTTPDNLTRFRVIALAQTRANQFGSGDHTFTVSRPVLVEPALPRFLREGDEVELRAIGRQKLADRETLTITCAADDGVELLGPATVTREAGRNEPAVAMFRARVNAGVTEAKVKFSVTSASGPADDVEIAIPVATRTIEVRETVAGAWSGPTFDPAKNVPSGWLSTPGTADILLSTTPYLPQLLGISVVLDYPHGCFEQKSSRLLVYTGLAGLLEFLPAAKERRENYARVIGETLREFEKSLLPDDTLPYWPFATEGDIFVTIQSAWAVARAEAEGIEVPETLSGALPRALTQIVLRRTRLEVPPALRAFALFALSETQDSPDEEITTAADELFLNRERLDDEARAFLALALSNWELEPERQRTLLSELPAEANARPFNPVTFSSTLRAEAVITAAKLAIAPEEVPAAVRERIRRDILDAPSLSTQENLWLLFTFAALLEDEAPAKLARPAPPADATAENGSAAAWTRRDLPRLANLVLRSSAKSGTFAIAARRTLAPAEQVAVGKGLRIERIVKNLTDSARTGSAEAPFRLGDQVLISFRFFAEKEQAYVAVEDALPAGLEIVNPNLEMIGKFYQIPDEPGFPTAWLSFSEMRDRQTNLYFDEMTAGAHSYAVLARATTAGTFAWPSAQMTPMYDARVYARTAPSTCVIAE